MRLLMTPANVTLANRLPTAVSWSSLPAGRPPEPRPEPRYRGDGRHGEPPSDEPRDGPGRPGDPPSGQPPRPAEPPSRSHRLRRVVHVIDQWRYDGRWWEEHELHRDYFFLELDGGAKLEIFREEDYWWAARLSD